MTAYYIEINLEYVELSKKRIKSDLGMLVEIKLS
jgi:hypothetical protein